MIFTSYTYVAFLAASVLLHWSLPSRWRNVTLVALSYVFYCSWRWEFGFLLLAVSVFTWGYGMLLSRRDGDRRLLALGILIELAPLAYYKYAGFFLGNVKGFGDILGLHWGIRWPELALPLGISFFTFQGLAYLIDVANGEAPMRLDHFLLYKAFWPQLIAGPIIRPHEIRDQISGDRRLEYADVSAGAKRILHGFLKKAVLADTLAKYVEAVFDPTAMPGALDCVVGTTAFAMQIYFDFSGYSDIAIGSARWLGFRFPENFDYPYAARSPQEFWARWHMSLTRWIRDYVFNPLAFSARRAPRLAVLCLVFAMALCGLWHGPRWTFVLWGIWHGLLLVANHTVLRGLWADSKGQPPPARVTTMLAWAATMLGVGAGWVLFRAQSCAQAWAMFAVMGTLRGGLRPTILRENGVLIIAAFAVGLVGFQMLRGFGIRVGEQLRRSSAMYRMSKGAFYAALILAIVVFESDVKTFVYFQF